MKTTIQKVHAKPGQRIIAMSDIHGHLNNMVQLLQKVNCSENDILVIVGDLVDKGPNSLQTVHYLMDLSSKNQVYISQGNVDEFRMHILCDTTEGSDQRFCDFIHWQQKCWGCGLLLEMLSALELSAENLTIDNAGKYKKLLQEQYAQEINFLRHLPTILDMDSYIFVHGGIPTDDLESLTETDQHDWLKNDRFLEKGYRFSKCVITGHWPVSIYRHEENDVKPLFEYDRRIICMDGGCGLQEAGQLNALIFPDKDTAMENITWDFYDGFPIVTALEAQKKKPFSLYLQFSNNEVDRLEERGNMVLCRHKNSGKELWVPSSFLHQYDDETWHADSYSDALLEVKPGDKISVVFSNSSGCYGKINGLVGWYYGGIQNDSI